MSSHRTTRRSILGGTIGLAALGNATVAQVTPHPDAELIAACQAFDDQERQFLALHYGPNPIAEDNQKFDTAVQPIWAAQERLLPTIYNHRATTAEGFAARIRTVFLEDQEVAKDMQAALAEGSFVNETLMAALLRDLAVWAGVEEASATLAGTPAPELPSPQHPDAALIQASAEHIENWTSYNLSEDGGETDDDPLWAIYMRSHAAISGATPTTIEGIAAKARAAKIEARNPNGQEHPHGSAARWAWDVVNDLLRVTGSVVA